MSLPARFERPSSLSRWLSRTPFSTRGLDKLDPPLEANAEEYDENVRNWLEVEIRAEAELCSNMRSQLFKAERKRACTPFLPRYRGLS